MRVFVLYKWSRVTYSPGPLGAGVTGGSKLPSVGVWVMGTELGSLQEQQALLTAEPSLAPLLCFV